MFTFHTIRTFYGTGHLKCLLEAHILCKKSTLYVQTFFAQISYFFGRAKI